MAVGSLSAPAGSPRRALKLLDVIIRLRSFHKSVLRHLPLGAGPAGAVWRDAHCSVEKGNISVQETDTSCLNSAERKNCTGRLWLSDNKDNGSHCVVMNRNSGQDLHLEDFKIES